jgi:hypothetical protein
MHRCIFRYNSGNNNKHMEGWIKNGKECETSNKEGKN